MIEIEPSSFRDPSGFVFRSEGELYRQVNGCYQATYDELMRSGLYEELTEKQLLVRHIETKGLLVGSEAYCTIKPESIPFISYPYEWSFSQLKVAALAILRIQHIALKHGMSLKDASAFNIQFIGTKPILIDTLSFERCNEGSPWVAYRQFCQHFLAPLFLMAYLDPRLSILSREWIDGIPLETTVNIASVGLKLRPGFFIHIGLQAKAQDRYKDLTDFRSGLHAFRLKRRAFLALLDSLRVNVDKISWDPYKTQWAKYYENTNYSKIGTTEKRQFLQEIISTSSPGRIVDLGANTGQYSTLGSANGSQVIACDSDHGAVEICFRQAKREENQLLLALVIDLCNPTPATGWMNTERYSFIERAAKGTDLVIALALIHHLIIGNNVPMRYVVDLISCIGREAIIEFVDKKDSQIRRLLATRKDIFPDYSESGFEAALSKTCEVIRKARISETHRILYYVRRKH